MQRRTIIQCVAAALGGTVVQGASESQKIRVAMLGTRHGHAVGKLAALAANPDYEVAGVCEPDARALEQARSAAIYRDVRWLSMDELLGDSSIRVVVVESDVPTAIALGTKVIQANKHLHLEKPPGNRMEPFRDLVSEARRKKLLLQMGYIWRFHEGFSRAFEAARNGWLGDVYLYRGTINTDLSPELRQSTGRYSGGMMFELGCHHIDRLVAFWGRPRSVRSWLRHDSKITDKLADNTLSVLEYDNGLAVISTSARMPGASPHRSFELIGTDGAIVIQPVEPGTRMRVNLREPRGPYRAGWQDVQMTAQERYGGDFRDMARALKTGTALTYSYDHELLLQETLLRACGELKDPA